VVDVGGGGGVLECLSDVVVFQVGVLGEDLLEGPSRDDIPSPSASDPARNRHRCGIAWSKAAVRVILSNPRYTGRQVWNEQRKDEVLIDQSQEIDDHQALAAQQAHRAIAEANSTVHELTRGWRGRSYLFLFRLLPPRNERPVS
jgi:hypothetical protein